MRAIHAKGIVHRDLKPQNILLTHNVAPPRTPHASEITLKIGAWLYIDLVTYRPLCNLYNNYVMWRQTWPAKTSLSKLAIANLTVVKKNVWQPMLNESCNKKWKFETSVVCQITGNQLDHNLTFWYYFAATFGCTSLNPGSDNEPWLHKGIYLHKCARVLIAYMRQLRRYEEYVQSYQPFQRLNIFFLLWNHALPTFLSQYSHIPGFFLPR